MFNPILLLNNALGFAAYFRYPLIAVGTVIEGPILMIASGFLYRTGFFELAPLFVSIMIGDLLGDILWYCLGKYVADPVLKKDGKFVGITPERFEKIKGLFSRYHERILIFSKLTLGLGFAVGILTVAGMTRVSFKRFIIINAIGEIFLVSTLIAIGYFFGEVYLKISDNMKIGFLVAVALLVVTSFYVFSKYVAHKSREL